MACFRGFHEVIDPIAKSLGIDLVRANRLADSFDGRLTGKCSEIVTLKEKDFLLTWARKSYSTKSDDCYGDGANDLPMIETAGIGIALWPSQSSLEMSPISYREEDLSLVSKF